MPCAKCGKRVLSAQDVIILGRMPPDEIFKEEVAWHLDCARKDGRIRPLLKLLGLKPTKKVKPKK